MHHAKDQIWPDFHTWSGQEILTALSINDINISPIAGDVILKCPANASYGQAIIQYFQGTSLEPHEQCWSHSAIFVGNNSVLDAQFSRNPQIKLQSLTDFLQEDIKSHYRFLRHIKPLRQNEYINIYNNALDFANGKISYNKIGALMAPLNRKKSSSSFKISLSSVDCSELVSFILWKSASRFVFTEGSALTPSPAAFAISKRLYDYNILK